MNESWRQAEADAHEAKADAIGVALNALDGLDGALEPIEAAILLPARNMLARALDRHEAVAKLMATR